MATKNAQADQSPADTAAADQAAAAKAERERKAAEKAEQKRVADEQRAQAKAAREQEKIQKEASDAGIDLASITGTGPDSAVLLKDVRDAVKAKRKAEREAQPKKAPMTLSQRRAIVKLADDGPQVARTGFNELPYDYLVSVDLATRNDVTVAQPYTEKEEQDVEIPAAERVEGGPTTKKVKVDVEKTRDVVRPQYELTDKGRERAEGVNRKWKTWKPESRSPAATPQLDEQPTPVDAPDPEPVV